MLLFDNVANVVALHRNADCQVYWGKNVLWEHLVVWANYFYIDVYFFSPLKFHAESCKSKILCHFKEKKNHFQEKKNPFHLEF